MPTTVLNLSTYKVYVHGGVDEGIEALISLDVPGAIISLVFYSDRVKVLQPNRKDIQTATGFPIFFLNYRVAMFRNILDILRNEKPLQLQFNDATLSAQITSSEEPIGEAEK